MSGWWTALLGAVAVVGGAACARTDDRAPRPLSQATLAGAAELVQRAPVIFVGRVVELRPGRTAGLPEEPLVFNEVRIVVEESFKGGTAGDTLVVEQPSSEGRVFLDFTPLAVRDRVLLFVRLGAEGYYVAVPQGRYRANGDVLRALQRGPVADSLEGARVADFLAFLRAQRR